MFNNNYTYIIHVHVHIRICTCTFTVVHIHVQCITHVLYTRTCISQLRNPLDDKLVSSKHGQLYPQDTEVMSYMYTCNTTWTCIKYFLLAQCCTNCSREYWESSKECVRWPIDGEMQAVSLILIHCVLFKAHYLYSIRIAAEKGEDTRLAILL